MAGTYAHYAQVPVAVDASGKLVSKEPLLPVRVPVTMTVANLKVDAQQTVEEGDVLLVPKNELSQKGYERIKSDHQKLKSFLSRDKSGDCHRTCLDKLENFAEQAFVVPGGGSTAVNETVSPIQEALREFVVAKRDLENIGLRTQGLRRKAKLAEEKLERLRSSDMKKMLRSEIEKLETQVVEARAKISEIRGNAQSKVKRRRNRLDVRLGGLMPQIEKYRSETSIVAPKSGTVTNLQVSGEGQLVRSGTKILDIIPEDSELVGQMMVANRDIADIESGMEVNINLDALPEREFGTVDGKVKTVPQNATDDGGSGRSSESQQTARYKVIVELDQQSLTKNGEVYPFRLGMTFDGKIVTEYESLLERGLKKLLKLKDDLFES